MVESSYPLLNSLDFAVFGNDYVTLKKLQYQDIEIPAGFIFDGVTVKAPFTFIFSNKDLRKGIKAWLVYIFVEMYQICRGWR